MNKFLFVLFSLIMLSGCTDTKQPTYPHPHTEEVTQTQAVQLEEMSSAQLREYDKQAEKTCNLSGQQLYGGAIEVGTNSGKFTFGIYDPEYGFKQCYDYEALDHRKMGVKKYAELIYTRIQRMKELGADERVYLAMSSGYQRQYDANELIDALEKIFQDSLKTSVRRNIALLTQHEEGILAHQSLANGDPDVVLADMGGGTSIFSLPESVYSGIAVGSKYSVSQGTTAIDIDKMVSGASIPREFMSASRGMVNGGSMYVALHYCTEGFKSPDTDHEYTLGDLKKALEIIGNESAYTSIKETHQVPSTGLQREGIYLSAYACYKMFEKMGIKTFTLAERRSWIQAHVYNMIHHREFIRMK